jgi:uncharacterized protein (DUF2235 family)
MKRIVICADGTWNRPEEDLDKDFPTNVLKVARAVRPVDDHQVQQVVFYDWGIGSYYGGATGGAFGTGINKNIQDCYRFIVQNYNPGDELYLFGFSRGAYTVRSLSGFIYNCGILERSHARRIQQAVDLYKDRDEHPTEPKSVRFRSRYAHREPLRIKFIGVWDTVGALGIPIHILGFLNEKHVFHDTKIGPNVACARHALSIDERRDDFEPTIWQRRSGMDLKQVWFAGVHADIGGGYPPDGRGRQLSDIPLAWIVREAGVEGLAFEDHVTPSRRLSVVAEQHEEYSGFFKILGKHVRRIPRSTFIHSSVKERYERDPKYRPETLKKYLKKYGWDRVVD